MSFAEILPFKQGYDSNGFQINSSHNYILVIPCGFITLFDMVMYSH